MPDSWGNTLHHSSSLFKKWEIKAENTHSTARNKCLTCWVTSDAMGTSDVIRNTAHSLLVFYCIVTIDVVVKYTELLCYWPCVSRLVRFSKRAVRTVIVLVGELPLITYNTPLFRLFHFTLGKFQGSAILFIDWHVCFFIRQAFCFVSIIQSWGTYISVKFTKWRMTENL